MEEVGGEERGMILSVFGSEWGGDCLFVVRDTA